MPWYSITATDVRHEPTPCGANEESNVSSSSSCIASRDEMEQSPGRVMYSCRHDKLSMQATSALGSRLREVSALCRLASHDPWGGGIGAKMRGTRQMNV